MAENYWDYDTQTCRWTNLSSQVTIEGEDFPEELKPTVLERASHLIKSLYYESIHNQLHELNIMRKLK